jgi:putative Ca2+/H+ antiporter (TMEM165/GDT1 family)
MKVLKWIAYFSGVLGALLILAGIGSVITNKHNLQYLYTASYFLAGNSFLLIAISILLFIHLDQHKKDSSNAKLL